MQIMPFIPNSKLVDVRSNVNIRFFDPPEK
jgi:hypothetical protein